MVEGYSTETEQLQALKKWWDQNAKWVIGALVIAALVVGGWRVWDYLQAKRASEAAGLYAAVVQAEQKGNNVAIAEAARRLVRAYPDSAYGALAGLALAKSQLGQQHLSDAESTLRRVIEDSPDKGLAMIARIRLARVELQRGNVKQALATVRGYDKGPFAVTMLSLRGDALAQLGDVQDARAVYKKALALSKNGDGSMHQVLELRMANLPVTQAGSAMPGAAATGGGAPQPGTGGAP